MRTSSIVSAALTATGVAAAWVALSRRRRVQRHDRSVAVCVDGEDVRAVALRSGLGLDRTMELVASHGATHLSLRELSLGRLLASGRVVLSPPDNGDHHVERAGHTLELAGDGGILAHLETELTARLPQTEPTRHRNGRLRLIGDLTTLADIGLGFDSSLAARVRASGLDVVPRPVSYDWPEPTLIRRSIQQAGELGSLVAFSGAMILGHEMHLDVTVNALREHGLSMVYFSESRHQKGDWFVAKRLAPRVVLGHRLPPATLLALDVHSAAHRWTHLALERGIRLCYVDFIRVLHATEPLEGLHYLEHLRQALEESGFTIGRDVVQLPLESSTPSPTELSRIGLAAGGVAGSAATSVFGLPAPLSIAMSAVATVTAATAPCLDRPGSALEVSYPPSYGTKSLALALASLAPAAAVGGLHRSSSRRSTWLAGAAINGAAAVALAAVVGGDEYRLRIETFRGLGLDWAIPAAAALRSIPDPRLRRASLAVLGGTWAVIASRGIDLLGAIDAPPPERHTHHLSAAVRAVGDLGLAAGPRPARRWAGLGPAAAAAALRLASGDRRLAASLAAVVSAAGYSAALAGFRHPERSFDRTLAGTLPSLAAGLVMGAIVLLIGRRSTA